MLCLLPPQTAESEQPRKIRIAMYFVIKISLIWPVNQRSDIQVERQEIVKKFACRFTVHQHLTVTCNRIEVKQHAFVRPAGRNPKIALQPAHPGIIPRCGITWKAYRVRPKGVRGSGAHIAATTPSVDIPGRWNFDRRFFPGTAGRRQFWRGSLIRPVFRRHRDRLKLPKAIQTDFLTEWLLLWFKISFKRGKISRERHLAGFSTGYSYEE